MTNPKTISKTIDKGGQLEETLRNYFLDLGFFVVRGVKFFYQEFDVTDVDLWLYMRPSSLTRERTIVDIKNKRTPQAIERIFWTKGLQQVLGLERSIVVTTDMRPAVGEFGQITDVSVLDGNFLKKINRYQNNENRLTEEEFIFLMRSINSDRYRGAWHRRLAESKSLLLSQLDYGGFNQLLKEIAYFLEQSIIQIDQTEAACRALYLNISFLLITLDYILKDLSFVDNDRKNTELLNGIRYGAMGKEGMEKVVDTSMMLLENFLPDGRQLATSVKWDLVNTLNQVPADILQEYFTRPDVSRNLFSHAKKFEELAYKRYFINPTEISFDLQSVISVILDFSDIERRHFFDLFKQPDIQVTHFEQTDVNTIDETKNDQESEEETSAQVKKKLRVTI